jgi:UDP-2-acetamido-3-amino-2,3-dideoxy-glucuronate N-acetyltransferase|tara:strand:+ start:382 stop:762 length:381 start_codon:yes stop_codon:yes gene_type:complete
MLQIIKKDLTSHILILDKLDKKIKFKRIFFLVANKKIQRGDHAHKKCIQAFFSVKGSFFIECIISDGQKRKILIKPGKNLEIIYPLTWVKINLKKNDVCGVLCDRYYEEKDYIRDFKIFNKMTNKI